MTMSHGELLYFRTRAIGGYIPDAGRKLRHNSVTTRPTLAKFAK